MPATSKSKLSRWLHGIFRWLRIVVLLVLFLVVFVFVYLHQIGLPAFAKKTLVQKLQNAGWDVQFTTARLDWGHNLILENAAGRRVGQPLAPSFSAARAELDASPADLVSSKVKSLHIFNGQVRLPLSETNRDSLSLDDLQLHLTFLPNDLARLDHTSVTLRGIRLDLNGLVDHVSALRDWKFQRQGPRTNANYQAKLIKFSEVFAKLELSPPPKLEFNFTADGRDTNSLNVELKLTAPSAHTPWGSLQHLQVVTICTNLLHPAQFGIRASVQEVTTPHGSGDKISLTAHLSRTTASNYDASIILVAGSVAANWPSHAETNWINGVDLRWNGSAQLATNFVPFAINGQLECGPADSRWGSAAQTRLAVQASTLVEKPAAPDDWAFWAKLAPYAIQWQTEVSKVTTPKLVVEKAALAGAWLAPNLTVTNLAAKLYGGSLKANATLNINTRECRLKSFSDFDPLSVVHMMTPAAQRFFAQFEWQNPPRINGDLGVILPAWTNRQPDWRGEVAPTLKIAGDFAVGDCAFRKIPATSAASQFGYTNRTWTLPRIHAISTNGEVYLDYEGSEITHEYHFVVDSKMDPNMARPLFVPEQQKFFEEAQFTENPTIHADIRGQWRQQELLGFTANVAITNFVARKVPVDSFTAWVDYTNLVLTARDIDIIHLGKRAVAPLVVADFNKKLVTLTNVVSHIDPSQPILASGPHAPVYLLAFQFTPPPTIYINGSFAMHNPLATDLHFDIDGDHMRWTNLLADHISGRVDWVARSAVVTNVHATLYGGGHLDGTVSFLYEPKKGADFGCDFTVTNINLSQLVRGLSGKKTNKLEGLIDGRAVITSGHTTAKKSWVGYGYGNVSDGVIWEIPMFGMISPVLNEIKAGAGNSRARNATANFIITNGMVFSQDLTIHSSMVRLLYKGSVGFDKKLDATVEAEVLRDTPMIGPLVSFALMPFEKMFKFKVSGTMEKPMSEPLYVVPRMLMGIFRPFNTLKHLFPNNQNPDAPEPLTNPKQAK